MKLILKSQNLKVTIKHPKLGVLVFDGMIVNESEYQFYYENGFADLFLVSEVSEKIESSETSEAKITKYKGVENAKTKEK